MNKSYAATLRRARRLLDDSDGGWDEITDELERLNLNDPADLAIRGRCKVHARRFDEAIPDLEAAVSGGVDEPEVHFELGGALMTMANIEKLAAAGHTYHAHAAKRDPLQKTEKAIECLRNAVRLLPDSATAVYALCEELERLGRYDEALSVLCVYEKFDHTKNRTIYRHMGRVYGRLGKWRKSYTNYANSVWLNPPNPKSEANKRYRQITSIRKRAADIDPESYRSFIWLGLELHKTEWTRQAIDVIGTAARMQPSLELYMLIGDMHSSYLQLNEAIDNYLEGIRVLSDRYRPADIAPLYEALVMTLAECSRTSEAKEYASEAISLGADGPGIHLYLNAVDSSQGLDPLLCGWISPTYVNFSLRIEIDGEIISV